jgi:hypothetical protein
VTIRTVRSSAWEANPEPELRDLANGGAWCLPNPMSLNCGFGRGGQTHRFGFIISWATNAWPVQSSIASPMNTNSHPPCRDGYLVPS